MKKGQAAMEFLMTYGWAILVVLVAIGALAYFGVLSPDKILPEKCIISSGSGLFCDAFSITSGTSITLKVKNSLADDVNVTGGNNTYIGDGSNSCALAALTQIAADDSASLVFSTDGPDGTCAGFTAAGAKIKGDISLQFVDIDGFSKTTSGS